MTGLTRDHVCARRPGSEPAHDERAQRPGSGARDGETTMKRTTPTLTALRRTWWRASAIAVCAAVGAAVGAAAGHAQSPQQQTQPAGQPVLVCPAPGQPCFLSSGPQGQAPVQVYVPAGPQQPAPWAPPAPYGQYPQPYAQPYGQPYPAPMPYGYGAPAPGPAPVYVVPVPVQDGQPVATPWGAPVAAPPAAHSDPEVQRLRQELEQLRQQLGVQPDPAADQGQRRRSSTAAAAANAGDRSAGGHDADESDERRAQTGRMFHRGAMRLRVSSLSAEYQDYKASEAFWGLGLGFRYRFDEHWGMELTADAIVSFDDGVQFTSVPVTLSAIASLFPLSPVSPFLAGGAGVDFYAAPWSGDRFVQFVFPIGGGLEFDLGRLSLAVDVRRMLTTGRDTDSTGALRRDRLPDSWQALVSIGGLF